MNFPKIWFWLRTQTNNEKGVIYFRIYINGTDTNGGHSTKIKANQKEWLQEQQQISHTNKRAKVHNNILCTIESDLLAYWNTLGKDRVSLTANDFYKGYSETLCPKNLPTMQDVWNEYIEVIKKRVKADKVTNATYIAWCTTKNNFYKFLEFEAMPKMRVNQIRQSDFEKLELFYLNELQFENNYCSKQLAMIKTVMQYAKQKDYIISNPFEGMTKKRVQKPIKYLSNNEIELIENFKSKNATLQKVADFFIFQLCTGLDYVDILELKENHLISDNKGKWIVKQRHKTIGLEYPFFANIPLFIFPKCLEIIEKYKGIENLPKMTNQRLNFYLKCICEILKIEKPISTKYSRRTFAMRMLNEKGFSKEAVGVMLGDRDLKIVENHYAQANKQRVEIELTKLGL